MALRKRAASRGFSELDVEERGCGNYYVTLPGLTDMAQFAAFKAEAKSAGFAVTPRCDPTLIADGSVEAVFGTRRSIAAANTLRRRVAGHGFRTATIKQVACDRWSVIVPGITSKKVAKAFAIEARGAGFTVTFEPS